MKSQIVDEASYMIENNQLIYEAFGEKKSVLLDTQAKDFCVGKYGNGCGGGRVFVLYEEGVKVYHVQSGEVIVLIEGLKHTKSILKDGCLLNISTQDEVIVFNLSTMTKEEN